MHAGGVLLDAGLVTLAVEKFRGFKGLEGNCGFHEAVHAVHNHININLANVDILLLVLCLVVHVLRERELL